MFICGTLSRKLQLKLALPGHDIAVFSATPEIEGEPFRLGDFDKVRQGDTILYLGYDTRRSSTHPVSVFSLATVQPKGQMTNEGVKVDALQFRGDAIPGYSGGAVYTTNMEIVALITKSGPDRVNLAFSIAPILESNKMRPNPIVKSNLPSKN